MSTPTDGNESLYDLELDVRMELTLAETGKPGQEADGVKAVEAVLDPDTERYEVGLRNLLSAIGALEDGSRPDDHASQPEVAQSAASHPTAAVWPPPLGF